MGGEVTRALDAVFINRVVNDPSVFPWVSAPGIEYLDLTDVVADPANYLLVNEHGGFLFLPTHEGHYEVHTQLLPSGRVASLKAAQAAVGWMFEHTDATAITSYVPFGNEGARRLVEAMHFTHTGREGSWTYPSGQTVPLDWYILSKERFTCR